MQSARDMVGLAVVGLVALLVVELSGVEITKTAFSCEGRPSGYYADVAKGCRIYHMCDGIGRQFSYACPNATLFQQRMMVCDHWYMVNCSKAESDYGANLLIGQDRPFVEDDNPYARTPRPDLLSNSSEYGAIYRTSGQDQDLNVKNLVGADGGDESSTGEPTYFPPSYWSTGSLPSTSRPPVTKGYGRQNAEKNGAKAININSFNRNSNTASNTPKKQKVSSQADSNKPKYKFKSNFKATTPVYPTSVDDNARKFNDIGLLPPIPYASKKIDTFKEDGLPMLDLLPPTVFDNDRYPGDSPSGGSSNTPKGVNFPSDFKATTPVYPSKDELIKDLEKKLGGANPADHHSGGIVLPPASHLANFESKFRATTPQYPSFVEPTSPDPSSAGVLPPEYNIPAFFQSHFEATTPQYPKNVEPTSPNPYDVGLLPPKDVNFINFESQFEATTPQYPTHVEATSPDPSLVGLLAPSAPNQGASYGQQTTSVGLPPKFHQPPSLEQEFILNEAELQEQPGIRINNFMKSFNESQWQDLRKVFRIPEYDFPLEDASRPSYESIVNSFEPKLVRRNAKMVGIINV